jgi:NAD(P)-dependent dehydrogenase (short-subunit alcohol dehydrogenase family)
MDIEGCTALVTGANRGLGRSYVDAPFAQGATKIYAGARDPATIADPRAMPLRLDVTSAEPVAAVAAACPDVKLVINNNRAGKASGRTCITFMQTKPQCGSGRR